MSVRVLYNFEHCNFHNAYSLISDRDRIFYRPQVIIISPKSMKTVLITYANHNIIFSNQWNVLTVSRIIINIDYTCIIYDKDGHFFMKCFKNISCILFPFCHFFQLFGANHSSATLPHKSVSHIVSQLFPYLYQ